MTEHELEPIRREFVHSQTSSGTTWQTLTPTTAWQSAGTLLLRHLGVEGQVLPAGFAVLNASGGGRL